MATPTQSHEVFVRLVAEVPVADVMHFQPGSTPTQHAQMVVSQEDPASVSPPDRSQITPVPSKRVTGKDLHWPCAESVAIH
jgi:hypothetical protein